MRGKRIAVCRLINNLRSIPAYAGETVYTSSSIERKGVYPRLCGGNIASALAVRLRTGLSPPMRGKRIYAADEGTITGSIPAYAGETEQIRKRYGVDGVYPRLCGGNTGCSSRDSISRGLSPPMRGKLGLLRVAKSAFRSIPAYAGETAPSLRP